MVAIIGGSANIVGEGAHMRHAITLTGPHAGAAGRARSRSRVTSRGLGLIALMVLAALALLGSVAVGDAVGAPGDLTQKAGLAGCIAEDTSDLDGCTDGKALDFALSVTVSPDGTSVYAASTNSAAVAVFDRAADGTLTQKAGTAGCISEGGSGGDCTDGKALIAVFSVTVSPDGTSVYTASLSGAVAVFDRAANGTLTQKAGTAGCISEDGSGGDCTDGKALLVAGSVTVSPDGTSVYAASSGSGAVAVFDRAADGTLTQKAGTAGCISEDGSGGDCTDGKALDEVRSVTVSPDGISVYATSFTTSAVAVFDRAADGTLTQKAGLPGCISEDGSGGDCTDGKALIGAYSVTVSPDGTSVYAASANSDAVAVFDRAADGTLTQKTGTAACISETGSSGDCTDGKALEFAVSVTVSPDGTSVYAASNDSFAVAVFDRAADGTLTQKAGTTGCISETGSGGECTDGRELGFAHSVTVSPDGTSVYTASQVDGAVAVFDREASSYADVVLADGPAGYWRFGEPSGPTAVDSSGNGNHGTYLGLPQLQVPGALAADPNTAVRMDGINDTVRVPDDSTLDVGNTFTAEGWIKRTATTKVHELMNKSFQLTVMGAANGNQVFLRKPGVSTIARTTGGIATGAYHHIAVTKNGSGPGSVKFYIDGALAPSVDVSAAQVIVDNNTLLTFGAAGSTPADYDEFAIYDGVLSAAQIQAHYDAGT
jgi:DNA-binding beta-propeller fold protein YncE